MAGKSSQSNCPNKHPSKHNSVSPVITASYHHLITCRQKASQHLTKLYLGGLALFWGALQKGPSQHQPTGSEPGHRNYAHLG